MAASAIGAHWHAVAARPLRHLQPLRPLRQPPPPVLPASSPSVLRPGGSRAARGRERMRSCSSLSAVRDPPAAAGEAAAAAAAAKRNKKDHNDNHDGDDDDAFPLHSLPESVLEMIRARTGGGTIRGLRTPPPAPDASLAVTLKGRALAFGSCPLRIREAEALFGASDDGGGGPEGASPPSASASSSSVIPRQALGLRGPARAEALRAAGDAPGGGGNGRAVLWSTAADAIKLVDAETGEPVATAAFRDSGGGDGRGGDGRGGDGRSGDDESGGEDGGGLRLAAYRTSAGTATYQLTTGWSELLHWLGARQAGCRVFIARYGGGGRGRAGGGGSDGVEEKKMNPDPRLLPPLFLVTAETAAGEPTVRGDRRRARWHTRALVGRQLKARVRAVPQPEPLPQLELRSDGLRAAVAEALSLGTGSGGGGVGGGSECLEGVVAAASHAATIATIAHFYDFRFSIADAKSLFAPLLPPGASGLRGREFGDALRAAEERRVVEGRSCSRGRNTSCSTTFDLVVDGSCGATGSNGGREGACGKREASTTTTVVQVQLTAGTQRTLGVVFFLSAGWPRALRAAGAFELGSQVVLERFEDAASGRFVFVATSAGRVAPPPSSEQGNAADLARRAETEALSLEARLSRRRALVEAYDSRRRRKAASGEGGKGKGGGGGEQHQSPTQAKTPTLAASMTLPLRSEFHLQSVYLPLSKAHEFFEYALPEAACGQRGTALYEALAAAAAEKAEKQERGESDDGDGAEEEDTDDGGEPRNVVWSTFVDIADALSGDILPVRLVATRVNDRTGSGGATGRGAPKVYAALRLTRNWCDVARVALGTRKLGARILLERYDCGPGEPPLLVATGLPRSSFSPSSGQGGKE